MKATATGGALGFGLFSSNCEQLVTLIKKWDYLNKLLLLKFGLVISSMILQVHKSLLDNAFNYIPSWVRYPKKIVVVIIYIIFTMHRG